MKAISNKTVDGYIGTFPGDVRAILKKIRQIIKKTAPKAVEGISYQMPGYKLNGKPLVYFAAFKNHISVFPTSSPMVSSIKALKKYQTGKGTFSFSLDEPLPLNLIKKIVSYRIKELAKK